MTQEDILNLIKQDEWMMDILRMAETLDFPDWVIGAGFVRNKIWNDLHGYSSKRNHTADVDLVYYDPKGNDQKTDEILSETLKKETGIPWEIVNQAYAHTWNHLPPYQSTEDALSRWPETATAVGVRLKDNTLTLTAPYGIDDLINLIVRPSPKFLGGTEKVKQRIEEKGWKEKWPKLTFNLS